MGLNTDGGWDYGGSYSKLSHTHIPIPKENVPQAANLRRVIVDKQLDIHLTPSQPYLWSLWTKQASSQTTNIYK